MGLRKIQDLENAQAFLADARNAGVTWQTWAKATGVDGRSVWRWIERLGSETDLTRQGDIPPSPEKPRMVELISNPTLSSSSQTIRICRGDFVVEVDKDFDEQALTRLLKVMKSCSI